MEFKFVDDLVLIMGVIKKEVIVEICFWEYYVLDVEWDVDVVVEFWVVGWINFLDGFIGSYGLDGFCFIFFEE